MVYNHSRSRRVFAGFLALMAGLGTFPVKSIAQHTEDRAYSSTVSVGSIMNFRLSGNTLTVGGAEGSTCIYTQAVGDSFQLTTLGDTLSAVIRWGCAYQE